MSVEIRDTSTGEYITEADYWQKDNYNKQKVMEVIDLRVGHAGLRALLKMELGLDREKEIC